MSLTLETRRPTIGGGRAEIPEPQLCDESFGAFDAIAAATVLLSSAALVSAVRAGKSL
ncbi:hypothetical protein Msil_3408 [Methylocella silvestris BL2]|uniref:Uncharacterized protein n=2 Tax=Methylocella silvestris TaxID=199596 RepID=B8ES91_METSB|nr:hypothetical protein Msil_3408 [Methylocella silvestris BL2]